MSFATEQDVLNGQWNAAEMAFQAERERARPFMLLRPKMLPDGNQWCALYGDNLQDGLCAFGNTPEAAALAFDAAWAKEDRSHIRPLVASAAATRSAETEGLGPEAGRAAAYKLRKRAA